LNATYFNVCKDKKTSFYIIGVVGGKTTQVENVNLELVGAQPFIVNSKVGIVVKK